MNNHAGGTEGFGVLWAAERGALKPLNLKRATARPSRDAIPQAPLGRAARQQRVLSGDPPRAFAFEMLRHALLKRREAKNFRVAEGDLRGTLRELRDADADRDRPEVPWGAPVRPREGHAVSSQSRRISSGA